MSHFSVLVIGQDIEGQLQPYHEYECTGTDDEYVVDVDVTDEVAEQFNQSQRVIRLADGRVFNRYDDRFYTGQPKDDFDRRIGRKSFVLPDGAAELDMAADEARKHGVGYLTMDEAAEAWCGVERKDDGRYYKHTNPNKKWDWWVVGGRWTGSLKLKPKAVGIVGRPGLMTEAAAPGYAGSAKKGDVDFAQMRTDAEIKGRALWKMARDITGGASWDSWDDTMGRYKDNPEQARAEYWAQPAIELLKASGKREFQWDIDDDLALDMDIYTQRRRDAACTFFAFVRDSRWTERGRMGWWASVSDEISKPQWDRMFNDMLDALPDDELLTVVDCHI